MGTEFVTIAFLQPVLHHNGLDPLAVRISHRYGKSVTNHVCIEQCNRTLYNMVVTGLSYIRQHIEAWWSQLRIDHMEWWIKIFKVRTIAAFRHTNNSLDFAQELMMNGFLHLHLPHHMWVYCTACTNDANIISISGTNLILERVWKQSFVDVQAVTGWVAVRTQHLGFVVCHPCVVRHVALCIWHKCAVLRLTFKAFLDDSFSEAAQKTTNDYIHVPVHILVCACNAHVAHQCKFTWRLRVRLSVWLKCWLLMYSGNGEKKHQFIALHVWSSCIQFTSSSIMTYNFAPTWLQVVLLKSA